MRAAVFGLSIVGAAVFAWGIATGQPWAGAMVAAALVVLWVGLRCESQVNRMADDNDGGIRSHVEVVDRGETA